MARNAIIALALVGYSDLAHGCNLPNLEACKGAAEAKMAAAPILSKGKKGQHDLCYAGAIYEQCYIDNAPGCDLADVTKYKQSVALVRSNLTATYGVECQHAAVTPTPTLKLSSGDSGSGSGRTLKLSGSGVKAWQVAVLMVLLCCCCLGLCIGGGIAVMQSKKPKGRSGRDREYEEYSQPLAPPPVAEPMVDPVPPTVPVVVAEEVPVVVETPMGPVVEEVIVDKVVDAPAEVALFGPPPTLLSAPVEYTTAPVAATEYTTTVAAPAYSVSTVMGPSAASNYATYQPYGNYGYATSSYASQPAVSYPSGTVSYTTSYATPGSVV